MQCFILNIKLLECGETVLRDCFILKINTAILGAPCRTALEHRQIHSTLNAECNYIFNIWPDCFNPMYGLY